MADTVFSKIGQYACISHYNIVFQKMQGETAQIPSANLCNLANKIPILFLQKKKKTFEISRSLCYNNYACLFVAQVLNL